MKRTQEEQKNALNGRELSRKLNEISIFDIEGQKKLLKELFNIDETQNIVIRPPFVCNNGKLIKFGGYAYINAFCTIENSGNIYIGDNVRIGPSVTIASTSHPINPQERKNGQLLNSEICIEDNVMIGANSVILGGVTIGANSVIGAGSVVTRSIPANVVAVGNPCKVIKNIIGK